MRPTSIKRKRATLALVATILVVTGAGAAAGVTFEGEVQGDSISQVEQAILVDDVYSLTGGTSGSLQGLGKVSDDNTSFRFAINVQQGEQYLVTLEVNNTASAQLNGQLALNVPAPLEVEADSPGTALNLERTSMSTWNFRIDETSGSVLLDITIAIPDDASPGFYTIEGTIRPTEV